MQVGKFTLINGLKVGLEKLSLPLRTTIYTIRSSREIMDFTFGFGTIFAELIRDKPKPYSVNVIRQRAEKGGQLAGDLTLHFAAQLLAFRRRALLSLEHPQHSAG